MKSLARKELGFPATQESGLGDALHSKRESTHPRTAVVRVAKLLDVDVRILHVLLQVSVHLLLFPRESLYVLHAEYSKQTQLQS